MLHARRVAPERNRKGFRALSLCLESGALQTMVGASSHIFIRTPQLRVHPPRRRRGQGRIEDGRAIQELSLPTGLLFFGVFQPQGSWKRVRGATDLRDVRNETEVEWFGLAMKNFGLALFGARNGSVFVEHSCDAGRVGLVDDGGWFRWKVTFLEGRSTALAKSFSVSVGNDAGTWNID